MTSSASTARLPAITIRTPIPLPSHFTATGRTLRRGWRNCWGLIAQPSASWSGLCAESDLIDEGKLQ